MILKKVIYNIVSTYFMNFIIFYFVLFPEFKIVEKYNDNESENILSLAKIKTNHELTQTKITNVLKDEHKPGFYY